jgi:hypothetical protein
MQMDKKTESIKIKTARGRLLSNLNLLYPHTIQVRSLYRTVCYDPFYSADYFEKDIAYLLSKDYISFVDEIIGGESDFYKRTVILTSRGKEVAEGTVNDPALEI